MQLVEEAKAILSEAEKLPSDVSQWSSTQRLDIADKIQKVQGKIHSEKNRANGKNHAEKFFEGFHLNVNKEIVSFIMVRLCKHFGIRYKRGDIRYLPNAYNKIDDNWDLFYNGGLQELRIIKTVDEETLKFKGYRIDLFGNTFQTDNKGRVNIFKGRSPKLNLTKEIQEGLEQVRHFVESVSQQQPQEVESSVTTNGIFEVFVSSDDFLDFNDSVDSYNFNYYDGMFNEEMDFEF